MKLSLRTPSLLALALLVAGCASEPSIRNASESAGYDVQLSGEITSLDPATRSVGLRGAGGNEVTVHAGDDVRNFSQLRVGDEVVLDYHRSVVIDLQPAGSGEGGAYRTQEVGRAAEGQTPGATASETVTVLAPIVAVDEQAYTVTVRGPDGEAAVLDVRKPEYRAQLHKLQIGDLVRVRFTEAAAISIRSKP